MEGINFLNAISYLSLFYLLEGNYVLSVEYLQIHYKYYQYLQYITFMAARLGFLFWVDEQHSARVSVLLNVDEKNSSWNLPIIIRSSGIMWIRVHNVFIYLNSIRRFQVSACMLALSVRLSIVVCNCMRTLPIWLRYISR